MIDIGEFSNDDIRIIDSQIPKATNLLSVQLGALEYLPDFGIDLRYFLENPVKFQNQSFRSYLIQALANNGINVASLDTEADALFETYVFNLAPQETSAGFMAR